MRLRELRLPLLIILLLVAATVVVSALVPGGLPELWPVLAVLGNLEQTLQLFDRFRGKQRTPSEPPPVSPTPVPAGYAGHPSGEPAHPRPRPERAALSPALRLARRIRSIPHSLLSSPAPRPSVV